MENITLKCEVETFGNNMTGEHDKCQLRSFLIAFQPETSVGLIEFIFCVYRTFRSQIVSELWDQQGSVLNLIFLLLWFFFYCNFVKSHFTEYNKSFFRSVGKKSSSFKKAF